MKLMKIRGIMNYEVEEIEHRPQSVNLWETERMQAFRKAGLIGCLNDTGVTSKNYKPYLMNEVWKDRVRRESLIKEQR